MKYYVPAVLIQEIHDLIQQSIITTICHTLCEKNKCADFITKLGALLNVDFFILSSPPHEILSHHEIDAI